MMDGVPQFGGVQLGRGDGTDPPTCGDVAGREPETEEPGAAPVMPSGETPPAPGWDADGLRRTGFPWVGAFSAGAELPRLPLVEAPPPVEAPPAEDPPPEEDCALAA